MDPFFLCTMYSSGSPVGVYVPIECPFTANQPNKEKHILRPAVFLHWSDFGEYRKKKKESIA